MDLNFGISLGGQTRFPAELQKTDLAIKTSFWKGKVLSYNRMNMIPDDDPGCCLFFSL